MDEIMVPAGARGSPGAIALLRRVRHPHVGRIVAVRCPLGYVQALNPCGPKVFAWRVVALSGPVSIHGKDEREFAVADECLVPFGALDAEIVDAYAINLARPGFDAALQDARHLFDEDSMNDEELDKMLMEAAKVALDNYKRAFVGLQIVR